MAIFYDVYFASLQNIQKQRLCDWVKCAYGAIFLPGYNSVRAYKTCGIKTAPGIPPLHTQRCAVNRLDELSAWLYEEKNQVRWSILCFLRSSLRLHVLYNRYHLWLFGAQSLDGSVHAYLNEPHYLNNHTRIQINQT